MAGYIGDIPVPQATQTRQSFTATASQTSFPTIGYTAGFIDVFLNGIKLLDTVDYAATNGSDVVLTTGAALNDILEVTIFDTFSTSSGTFTGTQTFADGADIITATAGTDNVRLGENAGNSIVSGGDNNVTIGKDAGTAITTGDRNTAVGFEAGKTHSTNAASTYIGYRAGYLATGESATFVGDNAGQNTTGNENTFLGQQAGYTVTSGAKNTIVGRYDGNENSLDLRTSSNNIMLSDGDGNPRFWINSNGAVSATANGVTHHTGTQHYHIFQNSAAGTYSHIVRNASASPGSHYMAELQYSGAAPNNTSAKFLQCRDTGGARLDIESNGDVKNTNNTYGALSDEKLKENIADSGSQWADIKAVKVRKYSLKEDELDAANKIGVVAQELEASGMNGLVTTQKDLDLETREDLGTETKSVKYSVLYMKAIKALQEAMARIETLETKVAALEAE